MKQLFTYTLEDISRAFPLEEWDERTLREFVGERSRGILHTEEWKEKMAILEKRAALVDIIKSFERRSWVV